MMNGYLVKPVRIILYLFLKFLFLIILVSNKGCDYYGFSEGVFSFTIIGTMALIAFERFSCIKNPLNKFKFEGSYIYSKFILK
jgi:hypothetical protein